MATTSLYLLAISSEKSVNLATRKFSFRKSDISSDPVSIISVVCLSFYSRFGLLG